MILWFIWFHLVFVFISDQAIAPAPPDGAAGDGQTFTIFAAEIFDAEFVE
jgi:hypothetical protein